jgi:hypothetical protein
MFEPVISFQLLLKLSLFAQIKIRSVIFMFNNSLLLLSADSHKFHLAVYLNAIGIVIYHSLGILGFNFFRKSFVFLKNCLKLFFFPRLHTGQF